MPVGGEGGERKKSDASNTQPRQTFRPPWVKEGPSPLPMPNAPWKSKNTRRESNTSDDKVENPLANVQLRKTSIPNKEPPENGTKDVTFVKPPLKPVPPREVSPKPREKNKFDVKLNSVEDRIKKEPPRRSPTVESELDREIPALRNKLVREESLRRLSHIPAPPPIPFLPPPPPPPPSVPPDFKRNPLNRIQLEKLENLRSRPKNRPDWTSMLKEIEGKRKLNHVQCNDRSTPILPRCKSQSKTGEHFLYESEKAQQSTVHNELLKQIQQGIQLKSVKTNDRSKPQLEGLRKFRRQMTIEEQIQKSVSMASIAPEEIADEADEMDDIDRVRDDLQSTKQMLAFELRNKEAQIRENKRLVSRLQALEAELEKERAKNRETVGGNTSNETEEKKIKNLQQEADQARKTKDEMEKKYHEASDALENTKSELEDIKKEKLELEKRLQDVLQGKRGSLAKQTSIVNGEETEEEEESESSEVDEGDDEETTKRKMEKQVKKMQNKLRNFKNKEDNAKKERLALREIIKKHQTAMREEKKKYKALQKEVNKMAALMKDDDSEEDDDEEEKEETDEETEEEESSEESESEESDEDSASEKSMSEPEEAPLNKKKENYAARVTRHESILAAIKKGNYLLKTNAERLQDDLNNQKEQTASLQEDLDSVLSELG
ncbi:hypothetical protein HHI36_022755 [Cryptolaemus montrouzieri]|uniref:WH2 domain-containing protein n=1 Tax=Cryptolaemus montrouzieri TaxID=559131 RepID=A0ABD2N0U4_9CUCU